MLDQAQSALGSTSSRLQRQSSKTGRTAPASWRSAGAFPVLRSCGVEVVGGLFRNPQGFADLGPSRPASRADFMTYQRLRRCDVRYVRQERAADSRARSLPAAEISRQVSPRLPCPRKSPLDVGQERHCLACPVGPSYTVSAKECSLYRPGNAYS